MILCLRTVKVSQFLEHSKSSLFCGLSFDTDLVIQAWDHSTNQVSSLSLGVTKPWIMLPPTEETDGLTRKSSKSCTEACHAARPFCTPHWSSGEKAFFPVWIGHSSRMSSCSHFSSTAFSDSTPLACTVWTQEDNTNDVLSWVLPNPCRSLILDSRMNLSPG